MGWKFKFSAQDRDLEYFFWRNKNPALPSDLQPPLHCAENLAKLQKFSVLPKTARSAQTVENLHTQFFQCFLYVLTCYKSLPASNPPDLLFACVVTLRWWHYRDAQFRGPKREGVEMDKRPYHFQSRTKEFFKVCISSQLLQAHAEK